MSEQKDALIVFAKVPSPGRVKTRLTTLLTPEEAASIYEAFLLDAIDQYSALPLDVRLYYVPTGSQIPATLRPDGVSIHEQKGEGLGKRMATAFVETFMAGYKRAVIIGTDHPTLPGDFIRQAFEVLQQPYSISLGPSEDGGYYLLGMNEFYAEVFQDMRYSHDRVFEETVARVALTPASLYILPEWYDVDTPNELRRLIQEVESHEATLMRTSPLLHKLRRKYKQLQ